MVRARWGPHERYLVTMAMLEEHCPELFLKRVEMTEMVREALEDMVEQAACRSGNDITSGA